MYWSKFTKKKIQLKKDKKILIVGGTGFIGYYLAKRCLKKWSVISFSKIIQEKLDFLKM